MPRKRLSSLVCAIGLLIVGWSGTSAAGEPDLSVLQERVQAYKKDDRGPYQAIRWFCPDGSVLPPDQRCATPGGLQHALPKTEVSRLADERKIYLGQILAGTPHDVFLDEAGGFARVKQYQLERYLQAVDDGWILRRARYYRGAVQAEDEENWGIDFLRWLLAKDDLLRTQFYFIRQTAKDIPHQAGDQRWTLIRGLAVQVADSYPEFLPYRIKLHGQPEKTDIQQLKIFLNARAARMPDDTRTALSTLIQELELAYEETTVSGLLRYAKRLPKSSIIVERLKRFVAAFGTGDEDLRAEQLKAVASLLRTIRMEMLAMASPTQRLAAVDLSLELEGLLFREAGAWSTDTLRATLEKANALTEALVGCGLLEPWELATILPTIALPSDDAVQPSVSAFLDQVESLQRIADWTAGMTRAVYGPVVSQWSEFEPLAAGFIDDSIRSSPAAAFGAVAGRLSAAAGRYRPGTAVFMGLPDARESRGLNPGFARGPLEVVKGRADQVAFAKGTIYALEQAPPDLKPVAGILTVSEGNLVSHVQLLARNLGIPNAVITPRQLDALKTYSGQTVFYAVSPKGSVVLKPEHEMDAAEKALTEFRKRSSERIRVPLDKLDLGEVDLVSLRQIRAADSGRICGPKAANLGQLKALFPDRVVEGLVIPFGVFRRHMDQPMPDAATSYWRFLTDTFSKAETDRMSGVDEAAVEAFILDRLGRLREAIRKMAFLPNFETRLGGRFQKEFGAPLGGLPVFVRSDTNMEDLKDFTGAGLNLTVFNVCDADAVLQGIRDVWASPFTERSFRWRQHYLLNPENVYPSILILPTVNVETSGVMITAGITADQPDDVTVAFNRGPGGAVEGQAAETYLLQADGNVRLLSPSRTPLYNVLPETGGVQKQFASFDQPILTSTKLAALRALAVEIRQRLPGTPGIEGRGPFDVELGFMGGAIWLFQVRPFVENKRAKSSLYLQSLDGKVPAEDRVILDQPL